jgi:hypothetical protein
MKRKILDQCLEIALKETNPEHPQWKEGFIHFSFFVQKNKIVGWGTNQDGNPEPYLGYPSHSKVHAETVGWKKSKYHLDSKDSFEVVNIRTTKNKNIRLSKPWLLSISKSSRM